MPQLLYVLTRVENYYQTLLKISGKMILVVTNYSQVRMATIQGLLLKVWHLINQ